MRLNLLGPSDCDGISLNCSQTLTIPRHQRRHACDSFRHTASRVLRDGR